MLLKYVSVLLNRYSTSRSVSRFVGVVRHKKEKKEEKAIEPVAMPVRVAMFKKTYDGY